MYLLVSVLIIIVSVLIVLIVLVQNYKGGGLASNFAGSSQVMGVRKTADFLEKATWTLAVSLLVLSLLASMTIPRGTQQERSKIQEQIDNAVDPSQMPSFPTTMPQNQQEGQQQSPSPQGSQHLQADAGQAGRGPARGRDDAQALRAAHGGGPRRRGYLGVVSGQARAVRDGQQEEPLTPDYDSGRAVAEAGGARSAPQAGFTWPQ